MGIRGLNTYFKKHASSESIKKVPVSFFKGKTLVVDTSIYLYKFLEDGCLLENMYSFVTQCILEKITLLFVFDNKPNEIKYQEVLKRSQKRMDACNKYIELEESYQEMQDEMSEFEKQEMLYKIEGFKKKAIRVKEKHIEKVKQLLDALNVYYCDAPEEADVVCSYFVDRGIAWACISDDMDMFAYGCKRVIRDWSFQHKNAVLYDLALICNDIKVPFSNLQSVLLLLGNDYINTKLRLEIVIKWFRDYHKESTELSFYDWILKQNYIKNEKMKKLVEIQNVYEVPAVMILKKMPNAKKKADINLLHSILSPYGFIFI